MKYFRTFLIICVLGLLYASCTKKENYPIIPAITYNSFTPFCSGSTTDSAYLRVNFTDGDGDIGYPQSDASAPNDFYIVPLFDSVGNFITITLPNDSILSFPYKIPYITPSGSDKELNGIIQINLENIFQELDQLVSELSSHGLVAHTFRFQVWIFDRAGHKSNVLTTPTVEDCN
jgi:hypothetical protein